MNLLRNMATIQSYGIHRDKIKSIDSMLFIVNTVDDLQGYSLHDEHVYCVNPKVDVSSVL